MNIELNSKLKPFISNKARYKVAHGGRGSSKSWTVARMLLLKAHETKLRILCAREIQGSIRDSVHKLLKDQIELMELDGFIVTDTAIRHVNGSEFLFIGLYTNLSKIKSFEGVDVCWIEEAESISAASWEILDPTIRKPGSEMWITLNLRYDDDIIYTSLIKEPPDNAIVIKINWQDNKYFPEVLRAQKDRMRETDYELYLHIWEGHFKTVSDAQIFKGKFTVKEFNIYEITKYPEFLFGLDWGFSQDPLAVLRCCIVEDNQYRDLYIDYEDGGTRVEIDHTCKYIDRVPGAKKHKIRADSARPESISLVRRQGYNIVSVDKWKGSVEDGIEYIRGFRHVYIHPRCTNTAEEFAKYSHKVDKHSGEVLTAIIDKYNHWIDSLRYALTPRIKQGRKIGLVKKPKALRR